MKGVIYAKEIKLFIRMTGGEDEGVVDVDMVILTVMMDDGDFKGATNRKTP